MANRFREEPTVRLLRVEMQSFLYALRGDDRVLAQEMESGMRYVEAVEQAEGMFKAGSAGHIPRTSNL